jgi:hypothetical protein
MLTMHASRTPAQARSATQNYLALDARPELARQQLVIRLPEEHIALRCLVLMSKVAMRARPEQSPAAAGLQHIYFRKSIIGTALVALFGP